MGVNDVNRGHPSDYGPTMDLDDFDDEDTGQDQSSSVVAPVADPHNPNQESDWQMVSDPSQIVSPSSEEKQLRDDLKKNAYEDRTSAQCWLLAKNWYAIAPCLYEKSVC